MPEYKNVNIKMDVKKDADVLKWLESRKVKKTIVKLVRNQIALENASLQADEFEKFLANVAEQVKK